MTRPSRDEYGLHMAEAASLMADCTRRKVGGVLMRADYTFAALGYNGAPPGEPGCLTAGACPRGRMSREEVPSYQDGPTSYTEGAGKCIAWHDADNVIRTVRDEADWIGATFYSNHEPCPFCYEKLLQKPLARIVFRTPEGDMRIVHIEKRESA